MKDIIFEERSYYLDVEVFDKYGEGYWAQERFLVHGLDDIFWTDDPAKAASFLQDSLEQIIVQKEDEQ